MSALDYTSFIYNTYLSPDIHDFEACCVNKKKVIRNPFLVSPITETVDKIMYSLSESK